MRLFIAVNFPDHILDEIWQATEVLRRANYPVRWVKRELIHLTLKFLGDVSPPRLEGVERSMTAAVAGTKSFPVTVSGAGAFPNPRRPSVIWVGCEAVPPLELLQDSLERHMEAEGFPLEGRPFRPHITVGRVKREAPRSRLAGIGENLERVDLEVQALVSSVELMESHLGRGGPRYEARCSVEFDT